MLIFLSEYSLIMFDSKKQGKHWNITFYDYSAQSIQGDQLGNYGIFLFNFSQVYLLNFFLREIIVRYFIIAAIILVYILNVHHK